LARAVIPEQGYTRCRGRLRLAEPYGATVFERAAERALRAEVCSVKGVTVFCDHLAHPAPERQPGPLHEHFRGPAYFQGAEPDAGASP
jgi:hypothetical protein